MKIAITGASGLIGNALVPHLRGGGHEVVRLVRRSPQAADEVSWDPAAGTVDLDGLAGTEGVVHLAGAGVGNHRWTDAYKREILDSRVDGTHTIVRAITQLDPLPKVLVSASAIGFYGDTGDRAVDEASPAGQGFLADVVRAWEAAAAPAAAAGIRVVHPRTGLVVAEPDGLFTPLFSVLQLGLGMSTTGIPGAFGPLWPAVRLNLGGRLGSGRQFWSWISLRDEIRALQLLLEDDGLRGPVNLTGPVPVTNAEVAETMARVMGRRWLPPVPEFALKTLLGEFSTEVLGSARVLPTVLEGAGFTFEDATIESAVRTALAGS
jgi:NAD dependent epimerase/dehydratase family enzyme